MDNGHDNDATQDGASNSTQQFSATPSQPQQSPENLAQPEAPQADTSQPTMPQSSAPQGIFSTGELVVNTENLADLKPELSEENKSRIASAFAQTDATQKQDRLSEQMAEQDAISGTVLPAGSVGSNATSSTAKGDIRLPGTKKKSKLPLVLAALAVVAAVGGGGYLVLSQNTDTSGPVTATLSAAEEAFAKYANYLLYGEEKTALDGEYNDSQTYTFEQKLNSGTYDQEYWDKANTLLRTALAILRQSDSEDKTPLVTVFENYIASFEFIETYAQVGSIDDNALMMAYISNDLEGVETYLTNFYNKLESMNNEIAKTYVSQRKEQYRDIAGIYAIYRELGCISGETFDETACSSVTPSVELQNRLTEISTALARDTRLADMTVENSMQYLASYCWDIYSWLKDPSQLKGGSNE